MSILCGQQNGWGVIYMQIARNNYSHYWLITTNSDPPTPSDMVSCLLSLKIKQFSIQTEAHLTSLIFLERQHVKYFQHGPVVSSSVQNFLFRQTFNNPRARSPGYYSILQTKWFRESLSVNKQILCINNWNPQCGCKILKNNFISINFRLTVKAWPVLKWILIKSRIMIYLGPRSDKS